MNNPINKPTNLEQFEELIRIMKSMLDKNTEDYNQFEKWEAWFNSNRVKLKIKLEEKQYLMIYYNTDNEYSVQVWKTCEDYDIIDYVIMTNYIDEFCNNDTIITKD